MLYDFIEVFNAIKKHYSNAFSLVKFCKEAITTAQAESILEQQLALTQAAENTHKLKASQERRSLQKGGVISLQNVRCMALNQKKKGEVEERTKRQD
jgi:hypothetical protein